MKSRGKKKDSYPLRRSKAYDRNLKNFKLLIAYDEFQKDVIDIRKRLNIGTSGLCADNPKINWIDWAEKQSDEILNSKSFLEQEARIEKQFSEGKIGMKQRYKHMKLWYSKAPLLDLNASIDSIIEKYHLPLNYKYHIKVYVVGGEISAPEKNWKANAVPSYNDSDKARSLSITVYSQLAKDELKELSEYIEWIGKNDLPKYTDFENVDLAITLESKRLEKYVDDAGKLKQPTHAELADEYLGGRSKESRVRGMIRDIRIQKKNRFTKRAKK